MSSKRMAGGGTSRETISARVPLSSFPSAPGIRRHSPARSRRSIASRRSACGRSYSFQNLLLCTSGRSICPTEGVVPRHVGHVGDGVVAVDERAVEEPMPHAAGLVFNLEELSRVLRVDDPLEAPFVGVGLHRDQVALL